MTTRSDEARVPNAGRTDGEESPPPSVTAARARAASSPGTLVGVFERGTNFLVKNRWRLALLGPTAIYLALAGALFFGPTGVLLAAAVIAMLASFSEHIPADTWLSLYRAEPVAPGQAQALRLAVSSLSDRAGLVHEPALAIVPSLSVGAFSVGSGPRVAVLMTEGLLRRFQLPQLVAIAGHEIGHIKGGHLAVFSIADAMVRTAQLLFYTGVACLTADGVLWLTGEPTIPLLPVALLLLAPALNSALQMALPSDMEFEADQMAAHLLGQTKFVQDAEQSRELDRGSMLDDFRLPVPQRRIPIPSPLRCQAGAGARAAALATRPPAVLLPPLEVRQEPMISLLGFGPVEMRPRDRWPGLWF